jgi:uncharacterized membrane protein
MNSLAAWPVRVAAGHLRTVAAAAVALAAYPLLPRLLPASTRSIVTWDIAGVTFLALTAVLFVREGDDAAIARNAMAQQEGEWTMFWVTLAGVAFSFAALIQELPGTKDKAADLRTLHVTLAGATLLLSWLVTHVVFAYRYAHEYYTTTPGAAGLDGGLEFPGKEPPDYWDFLYFALVLGMTFQVSDVVITSRKLRRLATLHGFIGFMFNTVILALTVNIAATLLS